MSSLIYNPGQKRKSDLISEFVVRRDIYEEIMRDLESSNMDHPEQHYLLVGQRGMGKTTLLLRLRYGIEDSATLSSRLLPIVFPEEQYQISELAGLWEYVAEYLEDHHGFVGLYDDVEGYNLTANFEDEAFEVLNRALDKTGKHLVLLIDNIGELFHKLDKNEMHRLREILQTNNRVRVIGGSTNYLEAVLDYHQPFYEFFKIIRLDGLGKEETVRLIQQLGEIHGEKEKIERIVSETPGRIETLRILTGGVPRTIAIMFGIFLDHEHEHALKDLHRILDAVTPLYKHRMDDLPVQQQKIVDAVARHWEPITVKELAARTRLISKTLSAQLNQLEKEQIVVKQDTATRNKTYMIRERFWNIWYLMRYGRRDDKEKIIWLVKFLESWLSDDELKRRIDSFVEKVKRAEISEDQLEFFGKVYAALKNLPPHSKLRLKSIERETKEEIDMNDEEWFRCALEEYDKKNYYNSFRYLTKVRDLSGDRLRFLAGFGTNEAVEAIKEGTQNLDTDIDTERFHWCVVILDMLVKVAMARRGIILDYEALILSFEDFLKVQIVNNENNKMPPFDSLISIVLASEVIRSLILAGLYNAVFKVLDETLVTNQDNRTVYIKDQWKPLYLAVKYLYQPEELWKQPSELSTIAAHLVAIIMRKEDTKEKVTDL